MAEGEEETIVAKHKAYSHESRKLTHIGLYLREQILKKRYDKHLGSYKIRPQYKFLKPFYNKLLFSKRTGGGIFPIGCMEDMLAIEAPVFARNVSDLMHVYYGGSEPEFPTDEWTIHPTDWLRDIPLLMCYRAMFIGYMTRVTDDATRIFSENHHGVKKMRQFLNRFKKATGTLQTVW